MASVEAAINVVVRGSNAVNRLIENVGQLQSSVDRINSLTLDIAPRNLQRRANEFAATLEGSAARANDLGRSRNQILSQQRQAIERLTQAQLSQQRAVERAARAESELSRLAGRDERFSRRTDELRRSLRESAAEADNFNDQISNASDSVQELQSRLEGIRRATRRGIASAGSLIGVNQTLAASNAITALANEFNRYGDSLQRSGRESNLAERTLPRQIQAFGRLTQQIDQADQSLQALRSELQALGAQEVIIEIQPRPINRQELATPSGAREALARQAEAEAIQQENELRRQRNARRSELASEIATQESNLVQLERRTSGLGQTIARNQRLASETIASRNPASQTGLQISLNQIQAQAEALTLVANNSAIASTAFNRFTVAAQAASVKLARAQQSSFAALAAGFSSQAQNMPSGLGGAQAAGARSLVAQAIADIPSLTRSEAALTQHISLLNQLKSIVPFLSDEYTVLGDNIERLTNELQDAQRAGVERAAAGGMTGRTVVQQERARAQGPISLLPQFSVESEAKRLQFGQKLEDTFSAQVKLSEKLESSAIDLADKERLRLDIERAYDYLADVNSDKRIENSKRVAKGIEDEIRNLEEAAATRKRISAEEQSVTALTKRLGQARGRVEASVRTGLLSEDQGKSLAENVASAQAAVDERRLKLAAALTGEIERQRVSGERVNRASILAADQTERSLEKILRLFNEISNSSISIGKKSVLKDDVRKAFTALQDESSPTRVRDAERILDTVRTEFANVKGIDALRKRQAKYQEDFNKAVDAFDAAYQRLEAFDARAAFSSEIEAELAGMKEMADTAAKIDDQGKEAGKEFEDRLKAASDFKKILVDLQALEKRYENQASKGVAFDQERASLAELIARNSGDIVDKSRNNVNLMRDGLKLYRATLALRIAEAKATGSRAQASVSPEKIEFAKSNVLSRALDVQRRVSGLAALGIDPSSLKTEIGEIIDRITSMADAGIADVGRVAREVLDVSNVVKRVSNEAAGVAQPRRVDTAITNAQRSSEMFLSKLLALKTRGVNVDKEEQQIRAAIGQINKDSLHQSVASLDRLIEANSLASSRVRTEKSVLDSALKEDQIRQKIKNSLIDLQTLQKNYSIQQGRGVEASAEKLKLDQRLGQLQSDQLSPTLENLNLVANTVDEYRKLLSLRVSEAKLAGQYAEGRTQEQVEKARNTELNKALNLLSSINKLKALGIDLSQEEANANKTVNALKQIAGSATEAEVNRQAELIRNLSTTVKERKIELELSPPSGEAIEAARVSSLREAIKARESLLRLDLAGVDVAQEELRLRAAIDGLVGLQGTDEMANVTAAAEEIQKLRSMATELEAELPAGAMKGIDKLQNKLDDALALSGRLASQLADLGQVTSIDFSAELESLQKAIAAAGGEGRSDYASALESLETVSRVNELASFRLNSQKQEIKNYSEIEKYLKKLETLQNKYNTEEKKGVVFGQEKVDLQDQVNRLSIDSIGINSANVDALKRIVGQYKDYLDLRISEAQSAGKYAGGSGASALSTPEKVEKARAQLLSRALGIQGQVKKLEADGADIANERLQTETAILRLKELQGKATKDEVEMLAKQLLDISNLTKEVANAMPSKGRDKQFQGALSREEVIKRTNKVLTAFESATPGSGSAGEGVVSTFVKALTGGVPDALKSGFNFAKAAVQGIFDAFEMNSPSKVIIRIVKSLVRTYMTQLQANEGAIRALNEEVFSFEQGRQYEIPGSAIRRIPKGSETLMATVDRLASIVNAGLPALAKPGERMTASEMQRLVESKGSLLDLGEIPGISYDQLVETSDRGLQGTDVSSDLQLRKARQALVDFYEIPAKFTPDLKMSTEEYVQASRKLKMITGDINEMSEMMRLSGVKLATAFELLRMFSGLSFEKLGIPPELEQAVSTARQEPPAPAEAIKSTNAIPDSAIRALNPTGTVNTDAGMMSELDLAARNVSTILGAQDKIAEITKLISAKGSLLDPSDLLDLDKAYSQLSSGSGGEELEKLRNLYTEFFNIPPGFSSEVNDLLTETTSSLSATNDLTGSVIEEVTSLKDRAADLVSLFQEFESALQEAQGAGGAESAKAKADQVTKLTEPLPGLTGPGAEWLGAAVDHWASFSEQVSQLRSVAESRNLLTGDFDRDIEFLRDALYEGRSAPADPLNAFDAAAALKDKLAREFEDQLSRLADASSDIDSAADSAISDNEKDLRSSIEKLFDRIRDSIQSVFSGGGRGGRGPGGRGPGGAGGPGGNDPNDEFADAMRRLGNITRATNNDLEKLASDLAEIRDQADAASKEFRELGDGLGRIEREQARRDPDADILTRRFGPRAADAISEGLIGGAFPLLFGQGLGSSILGGAGGAAGGFLGDKLGFGLSLLGTALGTAFDAVAQAAQETGKALNSPIESFEKLKEVGLFASKQQEYYISKLIESGRTTEATAQIQAEMIRKVGVTGVNDLMRLGKASSDLSDAWAEFNLQLQAALAGPMAGLLRWLTGIVSVANQNRRIDIQQQEIASGLPPELRKKFTDEMNKIEREGFFKYKWDTNKEKQALIDLYRPAAVLPGLTPTEQDPNRAEADLQKQIQDAEKIRALAKQGEELDRRAVEMRRNNEETIYNLRKRAADMEREAVNYRRSLEDKLADKRMEIERTIIENDRKRRQIQIEALDFQLEKAKGGMDPIADGIIDATRTYLRSRAEGEVDLQQKERNMKLEIEKIERGTAQFKLEVEDRVRQMNEQRDAFSRDVAKTRLQMAEEEGRYLMDVEDYRLEQARRRVELALQEQNGIAKAEQEARQSGLTAPNTVDGFPITSLPGVRIDPFTGGQRHHKGVDVGAPTGTALGYEMAGKVLFAGAMEGYGKVIRVALDNGATLLAAHLNEVFVKQGQRFAANQRLATIGSTGRSTGPHLHHEGIMNGKADPIGTLDYVQLGKALQQPVNAARASGAQSGVVQALESLRRLTHQNESYGGDYGAFNRGGRGRNPRQSGIDPNLTSMTIAEILRRQSLPAGNSGRLHAVGADQITKSTLEGLLAGRYGDTGIKSSDKFSPQVQDKFWTFLARRRIVKGDPGATQRGFLRLWTGLEKADRGALSRAVSVLAKAGPGAIPLPTATPAPILPPARPARPSISDLPATPRRVGFQDLIARSGQLDAQSISLLKEENGLTKEQNRLAQQRAMFAYQEQITSPITRLRQQNQELQLEIDKREILNPLIAQGADPELIRGREKIIELERTYNSILNGLNESSRVQVQDALAKYNINSDLIDSTFELTEATINDLAVKAAAIGKEEELRKKLQEILDLRNQLKKAVKGEANAVADEIAKTTAASVKTPEKKIQERISKLSEELKGLTSIDALAIKSADNIGNAFGGAFRDIITGASSTQEALAGFFKNVADDFAAMAAEIIAKQITMIILQTILKALGAVAGGGGGSYSADPNFGGGMANSFTGNFGSGPGGLGSIGGGISMPDFAGGISGGISGFADGAAFTNSIVSSPTLFQFADGGVMKLGEMGEAGPEAIMPLERDSSGRLGVRATGLAVPFGRSVETSDEDGVQDVPFRREGVGLAIPFLKNQPGSALDQDMRGTIDVRFETVSIGGMDVVTREEAQKIGQEAAQRGAELAHKRYRNNPSARRAAGLA